MRRPAAAIGIALAAALAVAAPVTLARFTASGEAAASFSTGSIRPPTGLAASVAGPVVTLTWTPTTSSAATGYEVLRSATSGTGYRVVASVTARTATTTTDSPGAGTWYYVLRSSLQNWRSGFSSEAAAVVAGITTSTGYHDCAANAADTGGDNDGYESSPGNGCGVDGAIASDASSGTNTSTSCANTGKDRHRFWGYALGLPGTVTSIDGIEIKLVAGMNNNGGSSSICFQLSWDGGTTWTGTQQVALAGTALATYAAGSSTDTWGRSWSPADLDPAMFRIRLIDVTSQPNKTFRLDAVQLQVSYTP